MSEWQEICRRLSRRYSSESELEGRFFDCLDFILNWSDNNISRQKTIQFGHQGKYADLVLFDDDKLPIIVVEMKKQGVSITEHEIGQLYSYMRQELIPFGLLVGDKISLYYDEHERGTKAKRVLNLSFNDKKNTDGIELFKLLNKNSFSIEGMKNFCDNYLKEKNEIQEKFGSQVIIDNIANFQNADKDLDRKINGLIELYTTWLNEDFSVNNREYQYILNMPLQREWVMKEIINFDLASLSDNAFIIKFRELSSHISNLTRYLSMWNKDNKKVLEIREGFTNAVKHLSNMQEKDRYQAHNDFVGDGKFAVKHLKEAFWSEMIRNKFPDVPLLNSKTERFFDAIGVYIGDTYEEKLINVSNFYKRFSTQDMTLEMLSHLEHFVIAKNVRNEVGREFMKGNFPNYKEN